MVAIGGDAWRKSGACASPQGVRPPPVTGEKGGGGREGGREASDGGQAN